MLGRLFDGIGVGTLDPVLAWPPILWLSRLLAFLVLGGVTVIVILLLVRLARPTTMSAIVSGELPRLKTMRLLGQEFETSVEMDSIRDEQLAVLERRIDNLSALVETEVRNDKGE